MEQSRTLEQIQVKMKQEIQHKQAELMEQLQRRLDIQPASTQAVNGSANGFIPLLAQDRPITPSRTANGVGPLHPPRTPASLTSAFSTPVTVPKSTPINGHSHHNGVNANSAGAEGRGDVMTSSFSADESINGSTSQSSSHDTWDSTNAFTHERPVLTGSERSTPTPVMPSADSSNDLELVSQSIHIPVDVKEEDILNLSSNLSNGQLSQPKPTSAPIPTNTEQSEDLIDLDSLTSVGGGEDNTPRNKPLVGSGHSSSD